MNVNFMYSIKSKLIKYKYICHAILFACLLTSLLSCSRVPVPRLPHLEFSIAVYCTRWTFNFVVVVRATRHENPDMNTARSGRNPENRLVLSVQSTAERSKRSSLHGTYSSEHASTRKVGVVTPKFSAMRHSD